jgi:hypothetical protein
VEPETAQLAQMTVTSSDKPKTEMDALTTQLAHMTVTSSDKPKTEMDALTTQLAHMTVTSSDKPKKKAKPKALDYPIREDIASLSLDELNALHVPLVAWMKENQTKYPRLIIPYYRYRMKMEALMIQKK